MKILLLTEHTADERKSLAAVRSLARNGAEVTVASDIWSSPPLWSRFCQSRVRCPDPVNDMVNFSNWVTEQESQGHYDLVLPLSDYPTMALVEQQAKLSGDMELPIPPEKSCLGCHSSEELLKAATGSTSGSKVIPRAKGGG